MNLDLLNVREHTSEKYTPRTAYNAKSAHLTAAFAIDLTTRGEQFTKKMAGDAYIGFQLDQASDAVVLARQLYSRMKRDNVSILNIAGNGIYTLCEDGCTQDMINQFIYDVLKPIHQHLGIKKIHTGGQTGVDLAGAVAGYILEIPTEVTLPKGYLQRFEDHKDVTGTKEGVILQITSGANKILGHTPYNKMKK